MLAAIEFRNALYLDFEGEGERANNEIPRPQLAGVLSPKQNGTKFSYECVLFDSGWKPICNGIKSAHYSLFEDYFDALLVRLQKEKRHLVFWSDHERKVLQYFLSPPLYLALQPYLFNALRAAKRYLREKPVLVIDNSLENVYSALYPDRTPAFELPLGAAESIRRINRVLALPLRWKNITDADKHLIRSLIAYNQGDCQQTWLIAKKVGNYFEQ